MSEILDRILVILSGEDESYSILEISDLTGLKPSHVESAFRLLCSIEILSFDGDKAKIDPTLKQLILVQKEVEERENLLALI
jgi:DNA-binding IclR family transcriptional regulator